MAPRGETQWVRNLRVAGGGELRRGRRAQPFTAVELDDTAKPTVLRAYLEEWAWEVGAFFDGVGADSSDENWHGSRPTTRLPHHARVSRPVPCSAMLPLRIGVVHAGGAGRAGADGGRHQRRLPGDVS